MPQGRVRTLNAPSLPAPAANLVHQASTVLLPLLILTIPLEFTQQYLPLAILQVSRFVIGACLLVLLMQGVFGVDEVRFPPIRLWLPPVCFIGYSALSATLTSSGPGLKTVAAMIVYGLVALAAFNWSGTLPEQERFWTWLAISVIALSIVGLVEGTTGALIWNAPDAGFPRVNATFKDPNIYARVLTFGAVTALVLASRSRAHARTIFVAALVLASAALPFTFSRQGWVLGALVLGVAVLLAVNRWQALALAVLATVTFGAVVLLDPQVRERWNVLGQILTTQPPHVFDSPLLAFVNLLPLDSGRRYLIAAGFQMFYDHPIFGVGFGNFPANMLGHYRDFIVPEFKTIDSHSSFVTIIAEQGLVGLALALWWGFEFVRSTVRSARAEVRRPYVIAALLALLLIVLTSQLEGRLLQEPYAWLFVGVALGAQRISEASERALSKDPRRGARIALVHDIAGVARVQARLLREAGHDVDQIALSDIGAAWRWPAKAVALPVRLAAYLPAIGRLRGGHYDIVHIHWLSQGVVGLLIGRPFFAQAHGSDLHVNMRNPMLRMVTRSVLKKANMIFYVTPDLLAYASGFDRKFRYLPNPVDVEDVAEAPAPARLTRAVIFTRLASVKGVERIFPAAERLRRSVELTAIDWGPLAGEYVERYGRLVRFVPPVPHAEVGAFLRQFDIVIGQMQQGSLGLSELEAMAAGRPLVTGIDWSLYPDDPPPVIAAANADGIAAAVEKLKDDAPELARLSRDGREWVRRNHGLARHLHILEQAYFGSDDHS